MCSRCASPASLEFAAENADRQHERAENERHYLKGHTDLPVRRVRFAQGMLGIPVRDPAQCTRSNYKTTLVDSSPVGGATGLYRHSNQSLMLSAAPMTKHISKVTLSASRNIPFNKLILSQSNVRRTKCGVSIEDLAEDIARRTLLQSLNVRPVLDGDGNETGMYAAVKDAARRRRRWPKPAILDGACARFTEVGRCRRVFDSLRPAANSASPLSGFDVPTRCPAAMAILDEYLQSSRTESAVHDRPRASTRQR